MSWGCLTFYTIITILDNQKHIIFKWKNFFFLIKIIFNCNETILDHKIFYARLSSIQWKENFCILKILKLFQWGFLSYFLILWIRINVISNIICAHWNNKINNISINISNFFSIVLQPSTICSPSSTSKLIKVQYSMDCDMRSKCRCSCVLQFTRWRTVCCVLHRPMSQVIHRLEW